KLVAIFGCGDQEDYAEYFLDAMGMINDIVTERGAIVVGHWSTEGYDFEASKALVDDGHFVGLGIDEDRQPELTEKRVKDWCAQVYDEMCLAELAD
ncbi:MAG: flavodoxin domain-containing protein, partial [Pseudomonadota bacterium]